MFLNPVMVAAATAAIESNNGGGGGGLPSAVAAAVSAAACTPSTPASLTNSPIASPHPTTIAHHSSVIHESHRI